MEEMLVEEIPDAVVFTHSQRYLTECLLSDTAETQLFSPMPGHSQDAMLRILHG